MVIPIYAQDSVDIACWVNTILHKSKNAYMDDKKFPRVVDIIPPVIQKIQLILIFFCRFCFKYILTHFLPCTYSFKMIKYHQYFLAFLAYDNTD